MQGHEICFFAIDGKVSYQGSSMLESNAIVTKSKDTTKKQTNKLHFQHKICTQIIMSLGFVSK